MLPGMRPSIATTAGIQVQVESKYLEEHSDPDDLRYVFAYVVNIKNVGDTTATLQTRHWVITHGNGSMEEVRGPGVVGETPRLEPGQQHAYQSFCVLRTPRGTMHGSYQMVRENGDRFDALIPTFILAAMRGESDVTLN
jgi:ApaG protein